MTSNHSIHALMVGMSENWWRAGIMPCVRSDLERDKPVAYIFWLVDGPQGPVAVDTGYHPDYVAPDGTAKVQFSRVPTLDEVPYPVRMEPNLVIEFYSR